MKHDAPVKALIGSDNFRKKVGDFFGVTLTAPLEFKAYESGNSKVVWQISSPELPHSFILKEISFLDETVDHPCEEVTNHSLSPKQAFFELETIRKIKQSAEFSSYFPKNIGLFATSHPTNSSDAKRVGIVLAQEMLKKEKGASLFIAEEFIQGRAPSEKERERAIEIRQEGLKKNKRIWLTVDTHRNDVRITDDGRYIFLDVGNFELANKRDQQRLDEMLATPERTRR